MASWDKLSMPKDWGGWGIKKLHWFISTLILNIFWRGLTGNTLWSSILFGKYLKMNLIDMIRLPKRNSRNMSPIWKGFMKPYHWVGQFITWKVGNGKNVLVGINPIIGLEDDHKISPYVTNYLA